VSKIKKKRIGVRDDALSWLACAAVLAAAIILDKDSEPRKWHGAITWTAITFFGLLIWCRTRRKSLAFWFFWSACLVLHMFAMWLIFGQLLPRLVLDPLVLFPIPVILSIVLGVIAFIEPIILTAMFFMLERKLGKVRKSGNVEDI
jgi:hypothetical protein